MKDGKEMTEIPRIRIPPPGPRAREIIERDNRYLATTTKASPVVAEKGKGAIIEDVDGNQYIDFTCGIGVANTGHCHPEVIQAVEEQVHRLMHFAGTDFYYDVQTRLAEKLTAITPGDFPKKVFFTNSGTESIEAAIKIARWSTERRRFIGFLGSFHGRTMGSLAITASRIVHRERFFPMMPGVTHIPYAYCYRCPYKLSYPECDLWCAKILEEVYFSKLVPPSEVAAIFLEPVQGEGGYIVPPMKFIDELARIAQRNGILLVDDEVQAGFGRTGKMFAIEYSNAIPDIITMAKAMGSGIPIGAAVFDAKHDFGVKGAHSNTFGGNLVACSASLATIDVIQKERLLENSMKRGEQLGKRLDEMKEKYEMMGDNRGLGLMRATEFVKDRKSKEPAIQERDGILKRAYRKGLILLPCGESGIRYIPPLGIEKELLDTGLDILEDCIAEEHRER